MSGHRRHYSQSFRWQVLNDYFRTGCNKEQTAQKWGIPAANLYRWLANYCTDEKKVVSLQSNSAKEIAMESQGPSVETLKAQVQALQKTLEYEQLKVAAYERLIEIVKQEDGIDLLKKGGAKQ